MLRKRFFTLFRIMHTISRWLLILTFLIGTATVRANDEIFWFRGDMPPLNIVSGADQGKGFADQWGDYLLSKLPEYRHTWIAANTARETEEMRRRDNACSHAFLKTPQREQFLVFSEPLTWLLPNGLIVLRNQQAALEPFLNEQEEVRLDELIAARRLHISVANRRAYGGKIDPPIKAGLETGVVHNFNASDIFTSGLLQVGNRPNGTDAVIGYAVELNWAIHRLDLPANRYRFIPIAGETPLVPVYVACSRTPEGKQIIQRVNQVIAAGELPEFARQAYRAWLPSDVARYYDRILNNAGK